MTKAPDPASSVAAPGRSDPGMGTTAVWGGEARAAGGAGTQPTIERSVAFGYDDVDQWLRVATGAADGHIYSRNTNPTVAVFEEKIRLLEGGEAATSCASGMAAISNTLSALLAPGRRVVSVTDTYGGTSKIFTSFLPHWDVTVDLVDTDDAGAIEASVARGCDLLYLETPTNPTLKVLDLPRLIATGRAAGAVVVVDNTFATPVNQRPLALGADLVVHSATKFLGGHADALGGAVVGRADLVHQVFGFREINGATLDPTAAYLLVRGMKTLQLRIHRQNDNAATVAAYLRQHPKISDVHYPGLEDHPGHAIAAAQMDGFGGMLSFGLVGGMAAVRTVVERLPHAHAAANLGSVETIVGPPATTSHVELTAQERAALGIPEGLIRYSAGIEDSADLVAALDLALAAV